VLDGLDLEIHRGEVVALMGPSGAGKSTVASLLLGLRTPDGGTVTVDGADLAGIDLAGWRVQIGWLPQHPTLFRGSIRDNIAMGDPAATGDRIRDASALAGADGFISELRRAYDTRIGDGGRGLSAGETRRVALARAIVRDAPLLILDEPTANLDEETANAIGDLIRATASDRAVLVIEHRPQLAALADRTIRIESGKVLAGSAT
jgi:ABC-type multidrug transport system fused ATPase/permease subunit